MARAEEEVEFHPKLRPKQSRGSGPPILHGLAGTKEEMEFHSNSFPKAEF